MIEIFCSGVLPDCPGRDTLPACVLSRSPYVLERMFGGMVCSIWVYFFWTLSLLYIPEQTYPSRSRTRYAKKNKNDTFRTRYAKKKSRVPPQLGGSVFEAAEGLREFRVPGTRFFFVRGGYAKKYFSRTPKMMVKSWEITIFRWKIIIFQRKIMKNHYFSTQNHEKSSFFIEKSWIFMTGPLEWGVRILGFARISRTGYAIFFLFGGGTRKNIFRVPLKWW